MERALQYGKVKVRIMKCLCQGSARVGKTHVKCLLLGIRPESSASTGCVDTPVRAIRDVTLGKIRKASPKSWEKVDSDRMLGMMAKEMKLKGEEQPPHPKRPKKANVHAQGTGASTHVKRHTAVLKNRKVKTSAELSTGKELLQLITDAEGSPELSGQEWIYFIDSGGQPQFQEVLQAFIPNTSVLLLVFKLTESLSDFPLLQYQSLAGPTYVLGPHALSNQEILMRLARMLVLGQNQTGTGVQILFVGTFRDEYQKMLDDGKEGIETVDDKQKQIERLFQPLMDNIVYYNREQMIFQVNGLLAQEGTFDDEVALQLKQELSTQLSEVDPIEVPLRWYVLEAELQRKAETTNRLVVSREECNSIAEALHLDPEETPEALQFLSDHNIILYYPHVLERVVFTSSQILVDKVTELTERVYQIHDRGTSSNTQVQQRGRGSYKEMNYGEVSMNVLKDFKSHYVDGLFAPQDLVKVLEGLYIIASLSAGKFFMPALLPPLPSEKLTQLRDAQCLPLLYHFKSGLGPAGLFCAVVVYLISKQGWEIRRDQKPHEGAFSNAMCFRCPKMPLLVTLIDSFSQFEIHCQCHVDYRKEYLPIIKHTIADAIRTVVQDRKFRIPLPEPAFFCRKCSEMPFDHAAEIGLKNRPICMNDSLRVTEPNEQELQWLAPEEVSSDELSMSCLMEKLTPVIHRWWHIGMQLNVPHYVMKCFEQDYRDDCARCLSEILDYWRRNPSEQIPYTYHQVGKVLVKLEERSLAAQFLHV